MANQIRSQFGVKVTRDTEELVKRDMKIETLVMEGDKASSDVQTIGLVAEPLQVGEDLASAGFACFKLLDDTAHNTVQVGTLDGSTFVPFVEIHVGDPRFMVPIYTLDLYAKATVAPADLQFDVFER